jgi:putative cardiolipin synthase
MRLFNPFVRGRSRNLQYVFRLRDINYRMHAKTYTVDNQATILGGRNIGDEYFDAEPYAGTGLKLLVGVLKLLPIESQL